jgi:hypothetical protein
MNVTKKSSCRDLDLDFAGRQERLGPVREHAGAHEAGDDAGPTRLVDPIEVASTCHDRRVERPA